MQRPFTSGSRQAPDPFDQYLEENNFYRKHTARDSSCLFRTISEQMYDTQLHHLIIRKKCVNYMRNNKNYFQSLVDRDIDEYLDDMSKPKTYGTLIELQAAALFFQRNVYLFDPYTLGKYFAYRPQFTKVFRVFYTPERHFDSVFTSDYIKDVAICQSICYEILYKDLFKLPDVTFAVEQMLHSNSLETTGFRTECNEEGYCTRIFMEDGRTFDFDLPENTLCILENSRLCHFHNPNFPRFSDELQRDLKSTKREDTEHKFLSKTVDSLLPDKYISCVRQLLLEGITPFPYKVAKALDPNMYRNIEFDSWNEARKELKLQNWYNGDSNFKLMKYEKRRLRRILQVGAKCHVKLCKSENDLYTCHIQEMSMEKGYCIVFVEQLGEKRLVPYDSLKPLPPDQFKPWSLPYTLQRRIQKCNTYRCAREFNYRFKVDEQFTTQEYCLPELKSSMDIFDDDDPKRNNCIYKLKQFTHLENFRAHTMEYCTMPFTVDHSRDTQNDDKSQKNDSSRAPSRCSEAPKGDDNDSAMEHSGNQEVSPERASIYPTSTAYSDEYFSYGYDPSIIQTGPQAILPSNGAQVYYMCNTAGYPQTNGMYMTAPQPGQVIATQSPCGYYPQYYPMPPSCNNSNFSASPSLSRRGQMNTTPLTGRINFDVKKSVKANGADLPSDAATLRYFFNLGLEYHQKLSKNPNAGNTTNSVHDKSLIDSSSEINDSKEGIVAKTSPEPKGTKLDENGNNIEIKQEPNTKNGSNHTSGYSSSNKSNNGQRRFYSRYFNSKTGQSYRTGPQSGRYHQNDYNAPNGGKGSKPNPNNQHSTPNSRNGSSVGNHPRPSSATQMPAADQGMQTSPMIAFGADSGEMIQTPTTYNSNGQVVTSYMGSYVHDFDQPPPQTSGLYLPVPVAPSSFGIYAAPPSLGTGHVTMQTAGYHGYMSAPPPTAVPLHSSAHPTPPQGQIAPTYYTNSEHVAPSIIDGSMDPNQYSCVGCPQPVQFYYSPGNGVSAAAAQPGSTGGMPPQAYWCIPPPMQAHASPQPQTMAMVPSANQSSSSRWDVSPKQQHSNSAVEQ